MKTKKKVILVLALLSLVIFLSSAAYTFAKYRTASSNYTESEIANWGFVINDNDFFGTNNEKTFTIESEDIFKCTGASYHVSSGKIAPNSEGEFEIKIDYSAVTLNFKYDISFTDINRNLGLQAGDFVDLKIISYKINNGTSIDATNATTITKTINPSSVAGSKVESIKIKVKWVDDNTQTYNDKNDTSIGSRTDLDTLDVGYTVHLKLTQMQ